MTHVMDRAKRMGVVTPGSTPVSEPSRKAPSTADQALEGLPFGEDFRRERSSATKNTLEGLGYLAKSAIVAAVSLKAPFLPKPVRGIGLAIAAGYGITGVVDVAGEAWKVTAELREDISDLVEEVLLTPEEY